MLDLRSINAKFERFGETLIRRRFAFLGAVLLLSLFGMTGLSKVVVSSSMEDWFDKDDPMTISTDEFEELFGNSQTVTFLFQAEDVFAPEVLAAVRDMGDSLLERVPYADTVTSLADLEISVGNEEGMEIVNPFGASIPSDPAERERLKRIILSRPSLVNKLVSDDCRETWLVLSLHEYPPEEEWKKTDTVDPLYRTGEAVLEILKDPRWKSDKFTIKAAGMPVSETEERNFFGRETATRVLLGFGSMAVLLVLLLRSVGGVLVPLLTTVLAIVVVFGGMGWFGINVDANLMTLPVLLGMALSVGYAVHVVNSFKRFFRTTGKRKEAAVRAVEHTGWPILFTVVTTVGALLAFLTVNIRSIRWLGIASASVVIAVYVFIFLLVPVALSFGRDRRPVPEGTPHGTDEAFRSLGIRVLRRRKAILAVFAAAAGIGALGLLNINVDMDVFKFMGLKIPYVARLHDIVHSRLGSFYSFDIMIDLGKPEAAKDAGNLAAFERFLSAVGDFPLVKKDSGTAKIFSLLDIVKDLNRTLNGDDPKSYSVPGESDLVAQMLLLYEMSGGSKSGEWVDTEYRYLRTRIELLSFSAREIDREREEILRLGRDIFPGSRVSIIGSAMQFARINNLLVLGQIKSFLAALAVIALLLMFAFLSVKIGLIGLIPNLTPVVITGGVMGFSGFQLDMMTMTIMPMLLGIAVDDTIHFITQMRLEFDRTGDYRAAVLGSFAEIGKSLFMTTILLVLAFGAYFTSPVATMSHIGILSVAGLVSALIADYTMTPILIFVLKPFGPEKVRSAKAVRAAEATT